MPTSKAASLGDARGDPPAARLSAMGHFATTVATVLAIVLLAGGAWLARANFDSSRRTEDASDRARSQLSLTTKLLSTLEDAENGQRGYLLTGNVRYLAPYDAARARIDAILADIRAEPPLDSGQRRTLNDIQTLTAAKMVELGQTIALAQAGRRELALQLVRTNRGKGIMDTLRVRIDALGSNARAQLLRNRSGISPILPRVAAVVLGLLASLLLAAVAFGQHRARLAVGASLASLQRFTRAFGLSQGLLRNVSGAITFWGAGMERIYGYTSKQAIGRNSEELLQTEFPIPQLEIEAILETQGHWEGDVVNRDSGGSALDVATQLTLHEGTAGEGDAVIVFDNDISEARRAQREQAWQGDLLRTVIEAAPGLIYAKDRDGRMVLANRGAIDLIGRPWSEVQGRTDREFLADPVQAEFVMANDRRVMEEGQFEELEELVGSDADGPRAWLSTKTPLRNALGVVTGMVGVSVDITALRRRKTQLATLNAELSNALADRTAALLQRDLLLREVYHRVKNNLQIIDGLIVMQARQLEDADARAALLGLRNRIQALALVHHQLMHSKNLKTFDIAPFLKELAGNILEGAAERGVHVSVRAIPLEVDLDFAVPLGLLVSELVTNSLKHAFPEGSGVITVSLDRVEDGGIALVVSDDGKGRSPEDAAPGRGKPGLGTSIINGLVDQLGGEQMIGNEHGTRTEIRIGSPVHG